MDKAKPSNPATLLMQHSRAMAWQMRVEVQVLLVVVVVVVVVVALMA